MSSEPSFSPLRFPSLGGGDERRAASARAQGRAAGYAAGRAAADQELAARRRELENEYTMRLELMERGVAATRAALGAAVAAMQAQTLPVLADADAALVAGAVELAESIVGEALTDRVAAAAGAVRRAIATVGDESVQRIRLHPDDVNLAGEPPAGVEFVGDESLQQGDAVAELPNGIVDARIRTALMRARARARSGA